MRRRPKIGFVLGAGSARGWAHIGVLRALSEAGIKPDLIAGCSVGAFVGAAFSAGRLDQLEAWALALDWKRVLRLADFGLRGGLIKGERVNEVFREQFVECEFSELPIQFAAVATDLHSGQEIWLREGKVSVAIGASIAVPGLFRPVPYDDRYLVDGSVVNPIPVSLCRAMGADIILAVDLGSDLVGRYVGDDDRAPTRTGPRGFMSKVLPRFNRTGEKQAEPGPAEPLLSARDAAMGYCQGTPLRSEIEARDAAALQAATDAATEAIASRFGRAEVVGSIRAHVVTART